MAVVFVPGEAAAGERRVAATPETVTAMCRLGLEVRVAAGAGAAAGFPDDAYVEAGATTVVDPSEQGWSAADAVLVVGPPRPEEAAPLPEGAVVVGLLAAHRHRDLVRTLADGGVTSLAMELVPRVSRAQRMDALSSQANIAGYRAAVLAAYQLDKHFPLAMTAAGTIRPATVVVLGAGVAGLQAIATARRLGASVRASDIREAARGEVESLGADFIDLDAEARHEDERGYATEVGEDFLAMQRQVLGRHLAEAHAVITTAVVPGRPAPVLVTEPMVAGMRPGSVLIDLAAAEGGNCELTPPDGTVEHGSVSIVAASDLPGQMPGESSRLYARNLLAMVEALHDDEQPGRLRVDREDEVIGATVLTIDGTVVPAWLRDRIGTPADHGAGGTAT